MDNTTYQQKVLNTEGERLRYYTAISGDARDKERLGQMFINMSVRDILMKLSYTVIQIINELTSGEIESFRDVVTVFFKEDRMIYIGILVVAISFAMYLIDITS